MKFKSILAMIFGSIILSSCGPTIWDKAGATQQDYNADSYACEKDVRQSGYYGSGYYAAANMKQFFERCMIAKGWTARQ